MQTPSPSSKAVHTAPGSLDISNINIYKAKGDTDSVTKFLTSLGYINRPLKVTVDISIYINLTTTLTK